MSSVTNEAEEKKSPTALDLKLLEKNRAASQSGKRLVEKKVTNIEFQKEAQKNSDVKTNKSDSITVTNKLISIFHNFRLGFKGKGWRK